MKKRFYYLFSVFVFGVLVLSILVFKKDKDSGVVNVKASVSYNNDEKKFIITNLDTVNFIHAEIVIDEYYKLTDCNLMVGEPYEVWQVEFIHYNGRSYPSKYKPRFLSIWCDLKNKKKGFYAHKIN